MSRNGKPLLFVDGCKYRVNSKSGRKVRWRCASHERYGCKALVHTFDKTVIYYLNEHYNESQSAMCCYYAEFITSSRGGRQLRFNDYRFRFDKMSDRNNKIRWRCLSHSSKGCKAYVYTVDDEVVSVNDEHVCE
ncbi:hypothetical protein EVAR_17909_1 [Eumeta japonica]|uniref:FLYWCH-type domain-containing protein n=1 Tax=Eumeta variegata TaxID=151549 RepID=A0A4C1UYU5_EUMVA|nr:hypothetical protein EVAR_17909_1 [Eumeta japonica]